MEIHLIIFTLCGFLISLCKVLKLGKLIRLWQHKKLHPNATLKDIESFEKNTARNFYFYTNKNGKNSFN